MSIITKVLRQTCVYWAPVGYDAMGQRKYAEPVQMACRWDDFAKELTDSSSATVTSESAIMVSMDVAVGGVLLLGTLAGVTNAADPMSNAGARDIVRFGKTPNLKATQFLRVAYLSLQGGK